MATSLQTSSGVMPLHQSPQAQSTPPQPFDALYQPLPSDAFPMPLETALRLARTDLAAHQDANIHDHHAMIKAAVTLQRALRQVLAAVDAEAHTVEVTA